MQAGMESCLTKCIMAGGMGFVLGGAFGLFMSSVCLCWPTFTCAGYVLWDQALRERIGLLSPTVYNANICRVSRCPTTHLSLHKDKHCPIFLFENSFAAVSKTWALAPYHPPKISPLLGQSTLGLNAASKASGQNQTWKILLLQVV
jgi:hypothetical protein